MCPKYKQDKTLSNLIEGKRVVIVGPAQYLVGRDIGYIIDKYDTVCRVNYMAPECFLSDYGSRTDIMFYNCATASLEQMKEHLKKYPDFANNMKLVVCPVVKALGPEKWEEWKSDYISDVVKNFESINIHNNKFYWIGIDNYRNLFDLVACREPNSGILSILMILKHKPKELFITGFSFYLNKNSYFEGYATKARNWKGKSGHPQKPQIEFFKKYILKQDVKIDLYLKDLLKINHKNIQKL